MNKGPSYKILVPVISTYVLCLFLPTIDTLATFSFKLSAISIPLGVSTLVFPVIYPLADSITEVYGKKISLYTVICSYIMIMIFSFLNNALLFSSENSELYAFLIQPSMVLTFVGPIGYFLTMFLNIKFISKLKILMRGKHFALRSFICSGLTDALISVIVQPILFHDRGSYYVLKLLFGTILIKTVITLPLAFLAKGLVIIYRYVDNVEINSFNSDFVIHNAGVITK